MWRSAFMLIYSLQNVYGLYQHQLFCGNNTHRTRSCTTQILGDNNMDYDSCKVEYFPSNSPQCKTMVFGPIASNAHIGGVSLTPAILPIEHVDNTTKYFVNHTVLNITFSNIKWKTMKFRFKNKSMENHCRNIVISNDVKINDKSVLYYDCYWAFSDGNFNGQSHILDFEASDDKVINRGQYYFNIPSTQMLSPTVTELDWKPFIYIEILTSTMRLHIPPPPNRLKITAYQIEVMRECDRNMPCGEETVKNMTIRLKNNTQEVTYDHSLLRSPGSYYFLVTPLHDKCEERGPACQVVESPRITISNEVHQALNICIASVTALVVATLFAYYIVLRVIRRYWFKDYSLAISNDVIPPPTKVLVVYSTANRLHAECVSSFVAYLRSEYGFDVMYDGDISLTSHGDPYIWAEQAFQTATNIMYIVGPAEETNLFNTVYDKPIITAIKDIDKVLLSHIKANRATRCPKDVINVFFEHSNGVIPVETKHDKVFFLLKDWQKLIAYLSRNLLPRKQIMRTEKGRCFMEDLTRAKKLLNVKSSDVVIKFERANFLDKKVPL